MIKEKLIILFNPKRQHFKNRLKLRKGCLWKFIFSKQITRDKRYQRADTLKVYAFRNNIYLVENNRLQTFIKSKTIY